ncbi:alpha-L-rhamnosidase A [Fusarium denticulatum]|uniref:Alpha-L-rhamnosidase A n=1 Tax=Fusarium denticulatum TaxID=48507 RepID=A0A8H5WZT2_9HYPO|nr:alpha-L-rhamnosidase A [Fusarium denticulatum]
MLAFKSIFVILLQISSASLGTSRLTSKPCRNVAPSFWPDGIAVDTSYKPKTSKLSSFTLNSRSRVATVDYGTERAGLPFFEVLELEKPVQVELRFSEAFIYLKEPWSDGPYLFNTGQANSFRVETLNITQPGCYKSRFVQGGQRWQALRLLTDSFVTIRNVGLESTINTVEVRDLPGAFSCSDNILNDIWKLGAPATIDSCLGKSTQPAVWQIDPNNGAYVANQRPAMTIEGHSFANYTLEFDAFIDRGGLWWAMAQPLALDGLHIQLTGEMPPRSSFANTNKTVTPPNTLLLASGFGFVNQTTLPSYILASTKVPFSVKEKTWYRIKTVFGENGKLEISVDGREVLKVDLTNYAPGGKPVSTTGPFGFGAWQDQAAYFRNVIAYDTANKSVIYRNPLTSPETLVEYGTQENLGTVCLDGPKRDRLVWLGDFYHTSRIIGASTGGFNYTRGTFDFLLQTQIRSGQIAIAPYLGYDPTKTVTLSLERVYGLDDYQLLGFLAFVHYIRQTNDLQYARKTWAQWEKQLSWLASNINSTSGLADFGFTFLGAAQGGSLGSCATVETLNAAADIAEAIGKKTSSEYRKLATDLARSINQKLWNKALGTYGYALGELNTSSVAGTAFCLSSHVASKERAVSAIAALDELELGLGYKDRSTLNDHDIETKISPNTNGLLLQAILAAEDWDRAAKLIYNVWGAMLKDPETRSGASWEYLTAIGQPGLGAFTSLGHPWGGAATYILTEWVVGLRSADGIQGFGYKNWVVNPELGVHMGLSHARAKVPLYPSGEIEVEWSIKSKKMTVQIKAPPETRGVFWIGKTKKTLGNDSSYQFTIQL